MEETVAPCLEKSLARTELEAGVSLKAAQAVVQTIKKYCNALKVGNLKDLQVAINDVEKAELALRQQIATTKASWDFDIDSYLGAWVTTPVLRVEMVEEFIANKLPLCACREYN
jgi:hypothetical protein